MRGAWKADGEYIPELRTQRDSGGTFKMAYPVSSVGCDGAGARYSARVF
ncbi:MAG: hypothetical protein HFG43_14115 [Lachnospiraceae bacterium]|nr:hypothetical protein [Lachnospiraceae bacterium]MCI9592118.1 hypothetical protein [Lachnospiraceae bacterium]